MSLCPISQFPSFDLRVPIVQAALITLSWFAMTGLCAIMTVSTSLTIVRSRGKLTMAD